MKKKGLGLDREISAIAEVWKVLKDVSIEWLKNLFNKVLVERKMPKDWRVLLYQYLKAKETYKNVETIEKLCL